MENHPFSLADEQIKFIRSEVSKCNITLPNLEEELIDHICCMVEEKLAEGYSFDEAYRKVKLNVGIDSLKDIEIRTIILIDKKIQAMKTTLKITGISGLITLIIGSTFKIMHWPGGGMLIFIGFLVFALGYVPFLILTIKRENILKNKQYLAYTGIIAAFTVLVTILFTIMHWPLQQYLVYISWIAILLFLILLFNHSKRSDENQVLSLSVVLFLTILFVANMALYWVNLRNPKMSHYTLERNIMESAAIFNQKSVLYYHLLDTITSSENHNRINTLKISTDNIIDQIEHLKSRLFLSEEEKDTYLMHFIRKETANGVEEEAWKLGGAIKDYQEFVIKEFADVPGWVKYIESAIQFDKNDFNNPSPVVYNNLNRLIRDIKFIESELLARKIVK